MEELGGRFFLIQMIYHLWYHETYPYINISSESKKNHVIHSRENARRKFAAALPRFALPFVIDNNNKKRNKISLACCVGVLVVAPPRQSTPTVDRTVFRIGNLYLLTLSSFPLLWG